MIPPLTARSLTGKRVQAWDYKQKKSLLIAFLHADCRRCAHFVGQLRERAGELAELDAVALVIFSEAPPHAWSDALPPAIVLATDMSGHSPRAFLGVEAFGPRGQERVGVFVTDRYGELYARWVGGDDALPGVPEALSWLAQVQIACEECGAPHWSMD
jgi:peroxiredoxin